VLTKQPSGQTTIIFQVGKSGIYVGRIDFKLRAGKVVASAGRLLDLRDEAWVVTLSVVRSQWQKTTTDDRRLTIDNGPLTTDN